MSSTNRGVSAGRDKGVALTRGELVAFTDDDCRVAPDWIDSISGVFEADADATVVCGAPQAPKGSPALGRVAQFQPHRRIYQGAFPPRSSDWGITANMIVLPDMFDRIGTFDELLGAGALLRAGADFDFLIGCHAPAFEL